MNEQSAMSPLTSVALAPMTAKVTDCWYSVPLGQVHGVMEVGEQAEAGSGRGEAKAAGARRASEVKREVESFMMMDGWMDG